MWQEHACTVDCLNSMAFPMLSWPASWHEHICCACLHAQIHTLLTYPRTEVQTLGAELLASFLRAQVRARACSAWARPTLSRLACLVYTSACM